jgi:hypothetical protein
MKTTQYINNYLNRNEPQSAGAHILLTVNLSDLHIAPGLTPLSRELHEVSGVHLLCEVCQWGGVVPDVPE